jgi:hypothetical protein
MSLAALARFAAAPVAPVPEAIDRCGLCGQAVEAGHTHVVDVAQRTLACACRACQLLLSHPEAARGRYRSLPRRVLVDPAFELSDGQWAALQIPVGLAFVFNAAGAGASEPRWVANYPSAAGATEATLPAGPWAELAQAPLIRALAPDVEALLVFGRPGGARRETFLVPIDTCYALVGLVRMEWRGFSGGAVLWQAVDRFFVDLRARATPLTAEEAIP